MLMASSKKEKSNVIDEDVDDLDDLIGQFTPQPTKTPQSQTVSDRTQSPLPKPTVAQNQSAPPASSMTPAASESAADPTNAFSAEFAKEFAIGMESLLKEIGGEDALDAEGNTTEEELEKEKTLKTTWESIFAQTVDADSPSTSKPDSFQTRINMAMDKLKESESTLKADAGSSAENSEMESLLSELGKLGDNDEALQGILETMMSQIMSKDVLYEPFKELQDKFPTYLAENSSKLSEDDRKRYRSQHTYVTKILAAFEDPKYSDDDPESSIKILSLMNEMQAYGAPPTEIMGDLPPGLNLGPDGLPQLPDGCVIM